MSRRFRFTQFTRRPLRNRGSLRVERGGPLGRAGEEPAEDSAAKDEDLWDWFRRRYGIPPRELGNDRIALACWTLTKARQKHDRSDDIGERWDCYHDAYRAWALLGTEFGAWLQPRRAYDEDSQELVRTLRAQLAGVPPFHVWTDDIDGTDAATLRIGEAIDELEAMRSAASLWSRHVVDPVSILLTRPLAEKLYAAHAALPYGEVQPLVSRKAASRHSNAWTRSAMQVRALEHVAFLEGQGIKTGVARDTVAKAMSGGARDGSVGHVDPDTLKKWRRRMQPPWRDDPSPSNTIEIGFRISAARWAGELLKTGGVTGDEDMSALRALQAELLAAFGARYHRTVGLRMHDRGRTKPKRPSTRRRTKA